MTVDAYHVIDLLNKLLRADPAAVAALIESRVRYQGPGAACPGVTIMVDDAGKSWLGLLGVLNGLAAHEGKFVVAHYDDGGELSRFTLVRRGVEVARA